MGKSSEVNGNQVARQHITSPLCWAAKSLAGTGLRPAHSAVHAVCFDTDTDRRRVSW